MAGGRRLRVRELNAERGWDTLALIQRPEFLLKPSTAYSLTADRKVKAVSFELLETLSRGYGVPVEELWEWETKRS